MRGICDCGRPGKKHGSCYICDRCRGFEKAGICGGPMNERSFKRTKTRRAGNSILPMDYQRGENEKQPEIL